MNEREDAVVVGVKVRAAANWEVADQGPAEVVVIEADGHETVLCWSDCIHMGAYPEGGTGER